MFIATLLGAEGEREQVILLYPYSLVSFNVSFQKSYGESKLYPMFPRYNLLKEMIKEVTHHPDYMEHRHESKVQPL